jgi:type II secretory pathway component PulL
MPCARNHLEPAINVGLVPKVEQIRNGPLAGLRRIEKSASVRESVQMKRQDIRLSVRLDTDEVLEKVAARVEYAAEREAACGIDDWHGQVGPGDGTPTTKKNSAAGDTDFRGEGRLACPARSGRIRLPDASQW